MSNLKLENIYKSHKSGNKKIEILKDLNFELKESGFYVITGKSGSGKSTLLQIIAGIEQADSGNLYIDNQNVSNLSQDKFANLRLNKIGIIFQFFNLLPALSIIDNVALPKQLAGISKKESKILALEYLEKVGIKELANNYPHQVSGGEIQRAAIARALINKPKLILADEPTGNLDPKTAAKVIILFKELVEKENLSLIVVTHSEDVVKEASRAFKLENGKLL